VLEVQLGPVGAPAQRLGEGGAQEGLVHAELGEGLSQHFWRAIGALSHGLKQPGPFAWIEAQSSLGAC
jgi:hypothetical protein